MSPLPFFLGGERYSAAPHGQVRRSGHSAFVSRADPSFISRRGRATRTIRAPTSSFSLGTRFLSAVVQQRRRVFRTTADRSLGARRRRKGRGQRDGGPRRRSVAGSSCERGKGVPRSRRGLWTARSPRQRVPIRNPLTQTTRSTTDRSAPKRSFRVVRTWNAGAILGKTPVTISDYKGFLVEAVGIEPTSESL